MSVAAPAMRDELGWTDSQKGLVLSSFYWGYASGQIPASFYAQVYYLLLPLYCHIDLRILCTL